MAKLSRKSGKLWIAAILMIAPFFCNNSFSKPGDLTIFAEPNMVYALTVAARNYSKNKNVVVSVNFKSSFELIQNIDFGEPADLFISSHPDWAETLKHKGLVDVYNLSNIAEDKMALVTSSKNQKVNSYVIRDSDSIGAILRFLNHNKVPLIISSNYSSLGLYTDELINQNNIKSRFLYRKVNEDKKSIIDFLNENTEYCGIVLASEIKAEDNIRILKIIPDINIYYQGLVIAGDNMEKARDFLRYLKSDVAKKLLAENGFIVE